MIGWILGNLKAFALGAAGLLIAVAVALIRKSGADAERLKQAQADAKVAQQVQTARNKARGMDDVALDKEVDRWTRK